MLELTAVSAVAAMRSGEMKSEDYARALLDQARRLERLNAFIAIDREAVLESARNADVMRASGATLGLLHGLPIPVKDSVNTQALPTSNGTRSLRNFRPRRDAAVLRPLFAHGAILMGKTNLHELSYGWTSNNRLYGPVRNPYAEDCTPGGSSGGSGAAVAARMAPIAIAEDTLGSIRVPATMCGIAGFRPSHGRYPNDGIMPLADGKFDQVGPLARTVSDLVLFDAGVTGDAQPVRAMPLKGTRIGVSPEYFLNGLDPEVERITLDALRKLREAGATLVWGEITDIAKSASDCVSTILNHETRSSISKFLQEEEVGLSFDAVFRQASEEIQGFMMKDAFPPGRPSQDQYQAALRRREELRDAIRQYFERLDIVALAFPPILIPPPKIVEASEIDAQGEHSRFAIAMSRNVGFGSCLSMASLVLPAGLTSSGLPVGIEFDALKGNDRQLLAVGLSLEVALGSIKRPAL